MDDSKALVIKDEAMLAQLGAMANKEDTGGTAQQIPVLKINYDPDSKFDRGAWVVGQSKDQEGNITDEGQLVKGLVILMVKNRWSYFVQGDTRKNCNSPFYNFGDSVRGSNYGYACGSSCPYREDGINPRCKAQKVFFGLAVTAEGKMVDCISYLGGASYMPATDYIKSIEKAKVKGGYMPIPLFTSLTLLGSEKKKNAGTTYFEAVFKRGAMFSADEWKVFEKKRAEAINYIGGINNMVINNTPSEGKGARAESSGTVDVGALGTTPIEPMEDDIPFDVTPSVKMDADGGGTTDASTTATSAHVMARDSIDFDIESAIKNALAEG